MSAPLADVDRASDKTNGEPEKMNEKESGTGSVSPALHDYHHEGELCAIILRREIEAN